MLKKRGFKNIQVTQKSGDYGVDITAYSRHHKYAIQCKYYTGPVGISAVQQVYSGKRKYNCDKAAVLTNSTLLQQLMTWPKAIRLIYGAITVFLLGHIHFLL